MEEERETGRQNNPEANNVVLFRTAVKNCFKSIAESVSLEEFTNIMTVVKSNPQMAEKIHEVLSKQLFESMCEDLEDILSEGSLSNGLAKVAKLSEEASDRPNEIAWRPPGDVRRHLRSLDAQIIEEESKELEKKVEKMEAENERLMKEITERRKGARKMEERVERAAKILPTVLPDLEKTVEDLHELVSRVEETHLQ